MTPMGGEPDGPAGSGSAASGPTRQLRPYVLVRLAGLLEERHQLATEDVHFSQVLVSAVLTDLTDPGARVLDPFVGFGTTLAVAERMGRSAVGVELLPERCQIAAGRAPGSTVVTGDARRLHRLLGREVLRNGLFDLVLTSPPYRTEHDHPEDPLAGYEQPGPDYRSYLNDVTWVMSQAVDLLQPGGFLVINVANLSYLDRFTPLAWDLARSVAAVVPLVGESFVCWDQRLDDLAGDYLLVFRKPG